MPSDPTERLPAPQVAAVISAGAGSHLRRCLEAVGGQVYGPAVVYVVGGGDEVRHLAGEFDALWRPNLRAAMGAIGPEFTFVWAVRENAVPDPQALRVLVQDAQRVGAAVAGSKVVDAEDPEKLVSVGYATDVFDAPYRGLEEDELDQAQYDVIRDVAAVAGVSVLIRRDLYRGLGGIDRAMGPTAASIDFCQRARLRGARVVVVPGSVVRFTGSIDAADWRERAGEIRAMIKAYSPITLLWALPLTLLTGLFEGTVGILFGRFPLPGVVAAWLWNLPRLPSALRQRVQVRRGREAGDEELFRFQVAGSARLRAMWEETLERVRRRFPEGILSGFADAVEAGQQRIRHPAFFVGFMVVVFALVATREIWTQHLPIGGYSLPPPESAPPVLGSYAGGWNPAGLGSPEALRPAVGAVALTQVVLFGKGGLAVAAIVVASFLAGAFGLGRLLRTWGIGSVAGYFAGSVLMAGPALVAATATTHWTVIPAVAAVPWAVRSSLVPWPETWRGRIGALAGGVVATGLVGVFAPAALPIPLVAVGLWTLLGTGSRGWAAGRAALATALALPLLLPWLLYLDLPEFLSAGQSAYWNPAWPAVAGVGAAAIGAILGGDRVVSAVASWGATMAVVGALIARTADLGSGVEVLLSGLVLSALGAAVAAGAALEAVVRRRETGGWRAAASVVAGAGAVGLIVGTLLLAGPGRAGLPDDAMTGVFDFAIPEGGTPTRVLLFGPAADLPGDSRDFDGLGYRVFVPPYPSSWEAFLNEERLGDRALEAVLRDVVDGRSRRAGAALAEFGIGWVAFTEPSPLEQLFESQLDLVTLRSLDFPVFRNENPAAVAISADGTEWAGDGAAFSTDVGPADVRLAINADFRWGPGEWSQDGWATALDDPADVVEFSPHRPRRLAAWAAFAWLVVLVAGFALGREWVRR